MVHMSPQDRLLVLQQAAEQAPRTRPGDPVYQALSDLFDLTAQQIVAHGDYVPWRDEWTGIYRAASVLLAESDKLTTVSQ
jgi:hypothetical protein